MMCTSILQAIEVLVICSSNALCLLGFFSYRGHSAQSSHVCMRYLKWMTRDHMRQGIERCCAMQNCQTTFLQQAQQTPGLDFLVQAILRGNLLLPAAGSGATSFAPNNAAFTDMLQTLSTSSSPHTACVYLGFN